MSDPSSPGEILKALPHAVSFARIEELEHARSNRAWVLLDPAHRPLAALKSSHNPTKLHPEHQALTLLRDDPTTPRVLAAGHGALLLSWIPDAPRHPLDILQHASPHTASQLGAWLATCHTTPIPQDFELKLNLDPLPLHERLAKMAAKTFTRARKKMREPDQRMLDLATARLQGLIAQSHDLLAHKSLVHRDLNPHNILLDEHGALLGVVDFERAACAPAAWDFVKLRWWIFDHLPSAYWTHFERAYAEHTTLPEPVAVELFEVFEASMLLAYFHAVDRHDYAAHARAFLSN